jgi:hypothetical protein
MKVDGSKFDKNGQLKNGLFKEYFKEEQYLVKENS